MQALSGSERDSGAREGGWSMTTMNTKTGYFYGDCTEHGVWSRQGKPGCSECELTALRARIADLEGKTWDQKGSAIVNRDLQTQLAKANTAIQVALNCITGEHPVGVLGPCPHLILLEAYEARYIDKPTTGEA